MKITEEQITEEYLAEPLPVETTTSITPVVPVVFIGVIVLAAICSNLYSLTSKK